MKIHILAFGIAKDIMGGNTVDMATDEGINAAALKELLKEYYPALAELNSFMIAINNKYSTGTEVINETDEIAVIPPVSGG